MINDHISDMLARIKNAYAVHKKTVSLPHTKVTEAIGQVMLSEKYLAAVETLETAKGHKSLLLTLAYKDGAPTLNHLRRLSKPGIRQYAGLHDFKPVLSGMGIAILSTPKGIMTNRSAKLAHVGGEVLVELW